MFFLFLFLAVISNNFIPRPPTSITTTRSTTSTTTTTTTTTTTSTTTTTTSTTTTTTSKPEPEENNEVIRGRKVNSLVDGLQGQREQSGGRGRVKILVRHKKRPPPPSPQTSSIDGGGALHSSSIQRTSSSSSSITSAENKFTPPKAKGQQHNQNRPKPPVFRRQRVRFMPTQIEVRTEKSVRTATSKSFSLQRPLLPSLFSKRNGLLAAAIISGGSSSNNETTTSGQNDHHRLPVVKTEVSDKVGGLQHNTADPPPLAIRSFCRRPPMEKDEPHCFRPEPLYFYNVTSASCEPFFKGHCARSRNKFESVQICREQCLVKTSPKTTSSSISLSKDSKSHQKMTTSGSHQIDDRLLPVILTSAASAKTSSSSISATSSTPRPSLFKSRLPRRRGIGLF